MSKRLARLIAEPERDTKAVIGKLEELSSFSSEDVRFLAKHQQDTVKKIASLGLDPSDTTAEELYHTLQAKLTSDVNSFATAINYQAGEPQANARKLVELALAAAPKVEIYAMKLAVAKNLLRAEPPTRLMKKLKYRSLESMLKRENISQLFSVLSVVENHSWQKKFISRLGDLKASDFESRYLEYRAMPADNWLEVAQTERPVSYVPLMGAVAVWPVEALSKDVGAGFSLQTLLAAEIIEIDSTYLKNYQFQPQFGKLAAQIYESGEQQALQIAGKPFFDWNNLKCIFESQMQPLVSFTSLHPIFSWWKDAQATMLVGEELVSAHMADVFDNLFCGSDFSTRQVGNGVTAVKSSLLGKYAEHSNVANYFKSQLDDTALALEPAEAEDSIRTDMETGLI
jgi:hypothetical protein